MTRIKQTDMTTEKNLVDMGLGIFDKNFEKNVIKVYTTIIEMLRANITEKNVARHLIDIGYKTDDGWWLIEQAKEWEENDWYELIKKTI